MYAKAAESHLFGIDVRDGKVKDVLEASVLDRLETKRWVLKLTFNFVLRIFKVDQIIISKPKRGPKMHKAARRPDGYDE